MSRIKVISPEATTNLCTNPSLETGTTGWASSGLATFERSTTWQARGAWSARGVANTVGDKLQAPTVAVTNGLEYTVTARVKVSADGAFKASFGGVDQTDLDGGVLGGGGAEYDIEINVTAGATTPLRLEFEATALGMSGVAEIFVDAVQYEQKDHATTYIDGDQTDGTWTATRHASTSTRPASARSGGVLVDLGDDQDFKYRDLIGVGMPPLDHITQELASRDGALLQRVKAQPVILTFVGTLRGGSLPALHAARRSLADVIKPSPLRDIPALRLIYSGSDVDYEIDAHYLGGLEGQIEKPSSFERISLQFAAYDPRWVTDRDIGASLDVADTIGANRIIRRIGGQWKAMHASGADARVALVAVGLDGTVYAGGIFTTIGGVAAAGMAQWNPVTEAWAVMGSGAAGGEPRSMAVGPDGKVYVGGSFTGMGGVANTSRIAVWDPATQTWAALSTGMNDTVRALRFGPDGKLYAGGVFTTAGGNSRLGITRWSGSTWETLSVDLIAGAGTGVYDIDFAPNGDLIVVGDFTTGAGAAFTRMAKRSYRTSTWTQVTNPPGAVSGFPADIAWAPDGLLYISGSFLEGGGMLRWNGAQFLELGSGPNSTVQDFDFDSKGIVYMVGNFTTAGGLFAADRIARWVGSAWLPLPVLIPAGTALDATANGDDIYITGEFSGNATTAGVATVNNPGSADGFPVVRVTGPCTLKSIENLTSDQEIVFDSLELAASEIVTIDLRPGNKTVVSTLRGNVASQVLAGSDISTFALEPGDNTIAVLASGGSADLYFRPRHWAAE
jgi:hypothetical protein